MTFYNQLLVEKTHKSEKQVASIGGNIGTVGIIFAIVFAPVSGLL
jgi:hypothetical protein